MLAATIENHISGIKNGIGLERLPSGDFKGNAVYFGIGILTYNLFQAQKALTMPEEWRHKTIKSIRWMFVETPAKLIKHGRPRFSQAPVRAGQCLFSGLKILLKNLLAKICSLW